MAERATMRNGKGSASHNDRTKESSTENVKDTTKSNQNIILAINANGSYERVRQGEDQLRQKEIELYKNIYGASLERKNNHYKKKGNKKAIKTIEEAYKTAPIKETIFQIGKGQNHSKAELFESLNAFLDQFNQYENVQIFSMAIHVDELATHAHVRWALSYETDKGDVEINQNAALREMGFEAKEPFDEELWMANHSSVNLGTKAGKTALKNAKTAYERYDNPMITFTDKMRELWYDTLEHLGYDIIRETDPKNVSRRNKLTQEYKQEQLSKNISTLQTKKNSLEQQLDYTMELMHENQGNDELNTLKGFIADYGLQRDYEAYKDNLMYERE